MKLKYYLRGLGIGIVAMGLIMIITSLNNKPASDEEVIARARELGMEFSTTLSNMKSEETETVTEEVTPKEEIETSEETVTEPEEKTVDNEETGNEESAGQQEEVTQEDGAEESTGNAEDNADNTDTTGNEETTTAVDNNTDSTGDEEYVILTISPGDGSGVLANKAQELGLVESSLEFDNYLITNGYANRLRVGSYEVKVGSSFEEIVKEIFN